MRPTVRILAPASLTALLALPSAAQEGSPWNSRVSIAIQAQWLIPSTGLEDAMERHGFGYEEELPLFGTRDHPFADDPERPVQVTVRWRPVGGLVVSGFWASPGSLGAVEGFRPGDFWLRVDPRTRVWGALVGFESGNRARISVGPALYGMSTEVTVRKRPDAGLATVPVEQPLGSFDRSVVGFVVEGGVELPPRSRVFADATVRYHWAPDVGVGPWEIPSDGFFSDATGTFPATDVSASGFVFGLGVGIRLGP